MKREIVSTENAPKAIGPYSQGVRVLSPAGTGALVYTSGQIPVNPETGLLVEGDIGAQTRRCLLNLQAVLEASDTSCANVVKTTVFLADMGDFKAMNAVYAEFFPTEPPARSTVAVAALPLGARVEIEAVAISGT